MSVHAGPNTVEDGLVLSLDAANFKSVNPRENLCPVNSVPDAVYDIEDSQVLAPDGNPSRRFYEGTTNLSFALSRTFSQSISVVQGKQYNYSCFIRQGSAGRSFRLQFDGAVSAFGSSLVIGFTPATQIVTSSFGGVVNTGFEDYSNGWYRFWFTTPIALASSNTITARIYMVNTAAGNALTNSYDNSTNLYVHYYGPQITTGLDVKPYVRTTGSAITLLTTITDISGNNTTGTLTNGVEYSNSNRGIFDLGTTNGLISHVGSSVPILNSITGSDPFTFSIMMRLKSYPPSGTAATTGLLQKGSYNGSFGLNLLYAVSSEGFWTQARFFFGVRNLTGTAGVTPGYGIFTPSSTMLLSLNQWYKVDFTHSFAGTTHTLKLYVNGVLDSTHQSSNSLFPINITNSSTLGINDQIIGGNFIRANIDVAFYNIYTRELSSQEIAQNFQALRGRFGI